MAAEAGQNLKSGLGDILKESSKLMALRGYYGTSMRDLAEQTGRSLSGLYHYFSNKDELLYLINFHGFSSLLGRLKALDSSLVDPMQCLYGLIYNHIKFFTGHRDEMKVMLWGTQPLPPDKSRAIRDLKDEYNAMAQKTVARVIGERTGKTPKAAELSRKTYLLFGMMNWAFAWYAPVHHGGIEELVDEIFHMFVQGLSVEREYKVMPGAVTSAVKKAAAEHRFGNNGFSNDL